MEVIHSTHPLFIAPPNYKLRLSAWCSRKNPRTYSFKRDSLSICFKPNIVLDSVDTARKIIVWVIYYKNYFLFQMSPFISQRFRFFILKKNLKSKWITLVILVYKIISLPLTFSTSIMLGSIIYSFIHSTNIYGASRVDVTITLLSTGYKTVQNA